ncbi:hypothetical protein C0581_02910 [Candidatus Parcubacteria bacterium]|nr:MAG: hypothetical protein C0581_02910 [Candidatus Parcubacteria bacterium]
MINVLLRFFVWLDNVVYKIISKLAIKDNGGTHPKHYILKYHDFFSDHTDISDTVLDIGCGKGENAFDVAKKVKSVTAIDIKEQNIEYAKKHYGRENIDFVIGDVLTYNFNKKFDKIVFSNVLEHIEDRVNFLKKLHDLSDTILLRVPMLDRDWLVVYKKEKGFEYRLDPTHYIEYTLNSLRKELDESGWNIDSHSVQFGEFWGVIKK